MLSLVELVRSVAPAKLKPLLLAVPVWGGVVLGAPDQVGVNWFQSMQPAVSTARLPSASSKPDASAIVLVSPQPVIGPGARGLALPKIDELKIELLERECRAILCACERRWV